MMNPAARRIVAIVDDDESVRTALLSLLRAADLPAKAFAPAEEFLASGQQDHFACLIADNRMPGMSGLELQAELNSRNRGIPTIFITAHGDTNLQMQALRAGASEFLPKPFRDDVLLEHVRAALETQAGGSIERGDYRW
jgi:FixJ family two-component response regulator